MTVTTPASTASSLTALAATAPTTQVGSGANDSSMNEFLQLLTAQLKNQDPTNPTDPTQFVAQLAQFSTVEQLTQSNTTLNTISSSLSGLTLGQYSGMINKTVTAAVTTGTVPASGSVSQSMDFNVTTAGLSNVNLQVTNSAGAVVSSTPVSGTSGSVAFNGTASNGQSLGAGQYNLALVGTSTSGAVTSAGTLTESGVVNSVMQGTNATWELVLANGNIVNASAVTSVN